LARSAARLRRRRRRQWGGQNREGLEGCRRSRPSPELRRRPRGRGKAGGGAGERAAREGNFTAVARLQRKRAREKKHQNSRAGLRRMQRHGISLQCAKLYRLCWRRIQRARGIKSVILALRYFSAAAGDALREALGIGTRYLLPIGLVVCRRIG
jgi:hypothetical protein